MKRLTFVCEHHQSWITNHPHQAFEKIEQTYQVAELLMHKQAFIQAIPFLGTALETALILFEMRMESPQLTTKLTSLCILLAHAYAASNQHIEAQSILDKVRKKMLLAIDCGEGYQTKIAYYRHCASAINEANKDIYGTYHNNDMQGDSRIH